MRVAGEGNSLPFKPSSPVLDLLEVSPFQFSTHCRNWANQGCFGLSGGKWPSCQHLGLIRRPSRNLVVTCSRTEQLLSEFSTLMSANLAFGPALVLDYLSEKAQFSTYCLSSQL